MLRIVALVLIAKLQVHCSGMRVPSHESSVFPYAPFRVKMAATWVGLYDD